MAEVDPIETARNQPKSGTQDGTSFTAHSLSEQIEADRYLAEKTATSRRKLPIRYAKIKPGGAA
jgi:hypothetical protein